MNKINKFLLIGVVLVGVVMLLNRGVYEHWKPYVLEGSMRSWHTNKEDYQNVISPLL